MAKSRTGGRNAIVGNGGVGVATIGGGNIGGAAGAVGGWRMVNNMPVTPIINTPNADGNSDWADMTDTGARILRRQMGQTGDEAGKTRAYQGDTRTTYIQTSKSYLVNNALNSDMASVSTGYVPPGAQHWLRNGYNLNDAKNTIQSIDRGMKPLTQDIKLVRYEGEGNGGTFAIESMTGKKGMTISDLSRMSPKALNDMFAGKAKDVKQYTSMSWNMDRTSPRDRRYMNMPVKCEYSVQAGTHAVVTNNIGEHEVVVGRGYTQYCTGARMQNGQLVLSYTIMADKRPAYYKV